MEFIVDESAGTAVIENLRAANHDVLAVAEVMPAAHDVDVWRWGVERNAKAIVLVDAHLLDEVKQLVGKGRYRSLNACVNEALRVLLAHERRVHLEREMQEVSRDKMFLADIRATLEDFKFADADTARRLAGPGISDPNR